MQRIIRLDSRNTKVSGVFSADADHVFFLCDTDNANFDVELPDCRASNQTQLIFKNIGIGKVTVKPITGQFIDGGAFPCFKSVRLRNLFQ